MFLRYLIPSEYGIIVLAVTVLRPLQYHPIAFPVSQHHAACLYKMAAFMGLGFLGGKCVERSWRVLQVTAGVGQRDRAADLEPVLPNCHRRGNDAVYQVVRQHEVYVAWAAQGFQKPLLEEQEQHKRKRCSGYWAIHIGIPRIG